MPLAEPPGVKRAIPADAPHTQHIAGVGRRDERVLSIRDSVTVRIRVVRVGPHRQFVPVVSAVPVRVRVQRICPIPVDLLFIRSSVLIRIFLPVTLSIAIRVLLKRIQGQPKLIQGREPVTVVVIRAIPLAVAVCVL